MIKAILVLHVLLELGAGLTFVFFPQVFPGLEQVQGQSLHFLKAYGYAAIAMGSLGIIALLKYYQEGTLPVALFTLGVFHTCIAIAQVNTPLIPSMQIEPLILHGLIGLACWVYYWKEK
ncbi:hypothetical protein BKI52_27770 [marine bacterium AO1-C]|nr:hypothetical protein BKI52_27770 [marine bacterium AO1-C]